MATNAQQMNPEEAQHFAHFSVHNAVMAQMACPAGSCEAYRDIYTFRRWRAQGYVVLKGEHGTTVTTWVPIAKRNADSGVFNKLYNCSKLPAALEAHGADDYPTLLDACSPDVRKRWRWHEWSKRTDHDPTWLGVQVLDTFDEVA